MIISILNQKGGVGKTTIAIHLAAAAHLSGARTLLLDLDQQGSALDWSAARREEGSLLDGLAVAQAPQALRLPRIRELARGYDVVVADGPPRLGDITRAVAVASDVVVVPLRAGGFDLWACKSTIELLDSADQIRAEMGSAPSRRVFLLNGAAPRTKAFAAVKDTLKGETGLVLCPITIHQRTAYPEIVPHGETVLTMFPGSAAAKEIEALYVYLRAEETT